MRALAALRFARLRSACESYELAIRFANDFVGVCERRPIKRAIGYFEKKPSFVAYKTCTI